jgi:hypothetical protein
MKTLFIHLVISLIFLASVPIVFAGNEVLKEITIDIPSVMKELKEPLFTTNTEYKIVGNLLKYKVDTQFHNIKTFNISSGFQSDRKQLILDYSVSINGVKKDEKPIIGFDELTDNNKTIFLAKFPTYEARVGDRIIKEFTVTNKILPLEVKLFFINFSRSELYFPLDAYHFDSWDSPTPFHEISARVVYSNSIKIINDKTSLTCPLVVGGAIALNKTKIADFTFFYNNVNVSVSEKVFIGDNNNLFVVFEPIRSSQSGLEKGYLQDPTKYMGDEKVGCKLKVTYERADLIKFIFYISMLFLFITTILIWKVPKIRAELISLSFVIWSFQEVLLPFNGLQRPIGITLFDLTIILPLGTTIILFLSYFLKKYHKQVKG